jgi:putative colanic acid biosynthesis acetyltransferase WcaF
MIQLREFDNSGFDRGVPRWKEAVWLVVKTLFFLNSIPWPSGLRVALLRLFGAEIGARVVIRSGVNITFPWRVNIGNDVWLGEDALLLSLAPITIENDVCISHRVFLCTGSHDFRKRSFDLVTRPIAVRTGSWIAAQAFVAPGVEIGPESLVSAGSVVLETAPPRSIIRGNPGVVVKTLE